MLTARQVTEAKHNAYTDRLNEERLGNMTPEAVASFVREMETRFNGNPYGKG